MIITKKASLAPCCRRVSLLSPSAAAVLTAWISILISRLLPLSFVLFSMTSGTAEGFAPTTITSTRYSLSRNLILDNLPKENEEDFAVVAARPKNVNNNNYSIVRNGPNDAIVTICIGEKEFKTLKSTLQASPVLWEAVLRATNASANESAASPGGVSIFIDRDPKHFPTILAYLRNKAEGITYGHQDDDENRHKSYTKIEETMDNLENFIETAAIENDDKNKKGYNYRKHVRLPTVGDIFSSSNNLADELEDLYIEAKYYQLDELRDHLEESHVTVSILKFFRGTGGPNNNNNPFDEVRELYKTLQRVVLFVVGTGTTKVGVASIAQADLEAIQNSVSSIFDLG